MSRLTKRRIVRCIVRYHVGDRVRWSSVTRDPGQTCEFAMVVDRVTDGAIRLRLLARLARPDAGGRVRSVRGNGIWPFEERRSSPDPLRPEPEMSLDEAQAALRPEGAEDFRFASDGAGYAPRVYAERREGGRVHHARIVTAPGAAWWILPWRAPP